MNTNTSLKYLTVAINKASDPIHPNFRRALKPDTLMMHNSIRAAAARGFDANPGNPRGAIIAAGKALKDDARAYVTFFKDILGSVAFAAHMDCSQLQSRIDEEQLDAGLDAMQESHTVDIDDVPLYDVSDANRAPQARSPGVALPKDATIVEGDASEPYEGGEKPVPVAESVEDAYAAVKAAQGWVGLAFSAMNADQQAYWGVDGLCPLGQRVDESPEFGKVYTPISDFDEYRAWQKESFRRKSKVVAVSDELIDAMATS